MATSFSGGGSGREPPTMGKQLVKFITCDCESMLCSVAGTTTMGRECHTRRRDFSHGGIRQCSNPRLSESKLIINGWQNLEQSELVWQSTV